jgi:hypothetical protein
MSYAGMAAMRATLGDHGAWVIAGPVPEHQARVRAQGLFPPQLLSAGDLLADFV